MTKNLGHLAGNPRIVKSAKTAIELEEYVLNASAENTLAFDVQIYKLRSSSYSKNIAVVFSHAVLDEK